MATWHRSYPRGYYGWHNGRRVLWYLRNVEFSTDANHIAVVIECWEYTYVQTDIREAAPSAAPSTAGTSSHPRESLLSES